MQRQSLGSPGSKLHNYGGGASKEENLIAEDHKRKDQSSPVTDADEDNDKSQKPNKALQKPERFLHVIPLLTVICFLILYLSSHAPSQKDLAQFNGFKWSSKPEDSTEIDGLDAERFLEVKRGDILAIRSLKNLQEVGKHGLDNRLHRKFGDF